MLFQRLSLFMVLICSRPKSVKADLILKPRDTEAVVGDSTYFDCASNVNTNEVNWHHYAVGAKHHEDKCLYCFGRVHPHYENRIAVDRNFSTGNYQLRIKTVQQQDAGRYICQDNGGIGKSTSAQLVVLESSPTCTSNIKPDGLLGPNDCGLEPDTLQMSCHVSHYGNIPPVIRWKKAESMDPVNQSICQDIDNRMTCNLTLMVDLGLNGASYICETNRSTATAQLNCASDTIRVIHTKPDNSTKKTVQDAGKKVFCSVNSSQSCIYTWKWFDGVDEEIVANGPALVTHKPGWYKCESKCDIRGKQCTVVSNLVHVSELPKDTTKTLLIALLIPTITVILLMTACVLFFRIRKDRHVNKAPQVETFPLQDGDIGDNTQEFIKVEEITTRASRRWGIAGVAALKDLLYVVSSKSSKVEVFDITTYKLMHIGLLEGLENPMDLTSCKLNNCLYIMDLKSPNTPKYVIRVDSNVKTLGHWSTGEIYGNLSVTCKINVIVTSCDKSRLVIYSPDGTPLNVVSLSVDLIYPTHALELRNGQFLICYGIDEDNTHRVCILNEKGEIIKNSSITMETPSYLAVNESRLVFVADQGNNRVIVLNTDLELIGEVASEQSGLRSPKGICVNGKSTGKLFVVDNGVRSESKQRMGKLLIFTYDLPSQ